jgi:hypothetical protein
MFSYSAPELSYLQNREGYDNHVLLWCEPRHLTTNVAVPMGFWTGEEDRTFTIGGSPRLYQGGGVIQNIDPIIMESGLVVRNQNLTLSELHPGVALMLRGHNCYRAPTQLHIAMFDSLTGNLIAEPRRHWAGFLHDFTLQTPAVGGESTAPMSLTSAADRLTVGLTATRSDVMQSQRAGDRGRRHKNVTGTVGYNWGGKTPKESALGSVMTAQSSVFAGLASVKPGIK